MAGQEGALLNTGRGLERAQGAEVGEGREAEEMEAEAEDAAAEEGEAEEEETEAREEERGLADSSQSGGSWSHTADSSTQIQQPS